MKKTIAIVWMLGIAYFGAKFFLFPLTAIQSSHIEANVPPESDFRRLMERDLLAYSKASISSSATSIEFKLLRDGPTQSGMSLPKYYIWLKVFQISKLLKEGAARTAAVNRKSFEITHFISVEQIKATPDEVGNIFPEPLVTNIISMAGVK